jgi:tetratricopeptide (TPR) repeat protein
MKIIKSLPIYLLFLVVGCGLDGGMKSDRILNDAPYAGLTDSIKRFPNNAELYLKRGLLLSQNNRHEVATADYKKAWEIAPSEATALEFISNLLLTEEINPAIALLKECIKKYPENHEFNRRLGEVFMEIGKPEQALAQLDSILQKDSNNFEAWFDKGMLLARVDDTAAAVVALERAYALQPIDYIGINLANIYASTSNPKAIAICDSMINRDTAVVGVDPWYIKGTYYFNTKQYDQAIKLFDETIKRDWKFIEAYLDKGIILYEQKNYDEALEVFTLAATVSNTYPDCYYWMGRCYEATNRKEQAIANYQRAYSLDKTFTQAREALRRVKNS